jgi:pimeloyl-ACP methyl ester carboxylesterase
MSGKMRFGRLVVAMVMLGLGVASAAAAQPAGVAGAWQGVIAGALRVTLNLSVAADGRLSGNMISPDQGTTTAIENVSFKDRTLSLTVNVGSGRYVGKLNEAGTELTGTWTQGGQSLPLNFKRGDHNEAPALRRPQEPHKPYPYREEEVSYANTAAGIKLGGTLTLPKGAGPFPAVLLITGSGQQDRNETPAADHKPFLVLSDYLTRRGIAVLRVDDRGIGASTGDFAKSTTADFASDTLAGVKFLKARSDIQHNRIGLIGHSEGGVVAPMVAAQSSDVAFIVLMAGMGAPGEAAAVEQDSLLLRAGGTPEAEIQANDSRLKKSFAVLREEPDLAKARPRLVRIANEYAAILPTDKRTEYRKRLDKEVDEMNGPWNRYMMQYDPTAALRKVSCPVLALFGEIDLVAPPKLHQAPMEAALRAGKNADYTVRVLPGLNHLFQKAKTGAPTEYETIEETINPAALKLMGDWIESHTRAKS